MQCLTTLRERREPRRIEFSQGTLRTDPEFATARIFDTTLRDGEQSPRTSFSYDDKREIAAALDAAGVDVIEAGFPVNSDAEFAAVRDVASAADTTVCGLARVVEDDIEAALDAGVDMVHAFASTSDVQIEDSMHASREAVIERSVETVVRAADSGAEVMFSPMDATRTDPDYLIEVVEAVSEAGVDWINVPDTCGVATPGRFAELIRTVREHTDARIDVHTHDDFGLASANALAGLEAGADQAQVSVGGIGERAGNAAFEQVIMAAESVYGADTGIDTTEITALARLVEERSGVDQPPNAPVVGDNAFAHESGIHAAGVIENSATFEPGVMTPEMVGAERELVLGKHTGTHSVRERLCDAGYDPTDEQVRAVTREVKDRGADGDEITEETLETVAEANGVDREAERVTEGPAR
ncbi:2-isopropylmalate synthase [Halolamina sp. CBA1230]|uniref:LeuA family protein n=1 Tax=Halolamina sp. CBA1230 TaxID=1853690 RepID=UPI0009A17483|nr:2-isopropylmalate synthase [Halolamina sp. CBA1230]QKY19236.1 2-isopropylmalate synthase [Halolamina sp. CBA1230]